MKKRTKRILIGIGIALGVIIASGGGFILYLKLGFRPQVFSLDDAPQEILDIQDDLVAKLDGGTFDWSDMPDFVIFSQYISDNSPLVKKLVKNWEEIVWFNITDQEFLWFIIENDSLIFNIGPTPPGTYGILITLDFAEMVRIIHRDVTPQNSFMQGGLKFEGNFNDVLTVNQIVETAAATLMGSFAPPIDVSGNFHITVDNPDLYNEDGLTLIPYITINLEPGHLGELHVATPSTGKAIIVNNRGEMVAELEGSAHTVHKFMNSSHVLLGGQEGFMEIWNYKTGEVETLAVPGGHHDFDYNPVTETFMVLDYVYSVDTWDGFPILYDKLSEYNINGDLLWEWDGSTEFVFNATRHMSLGHNLTFRGGADYTHGNSFTWDKEDGSIYLNFRNLDTIIKIDYATKDILWEAGRLTNFTLYNKNGIPVDSIFHQPHGLEKIGENRFIIYDNDLYNVSNPDTMTLENSQGYSRLLEFEIDGAAETMTELWSWVPTNDSYYLPESGGDADRLPDGNTLGSFGNKALVLNLQNPAILTEVTKEGEVAWELTINGENYTYFWVQNVERFYEKPLAEIQQSIIEVDNGILELNLTVWNGYKIDSVISGTVKVLADNQIIYENSFDFLPTWQPKNISISIDDLATNTKKLQLVIEDQDGIQTIIDLYTGGMSLLNKILIPSVIIVTTGLLIATYAILAKKNILPKILKK